MLNRTKSLWNRLFARKSTTAKKAPVRARRRAFLESLEDRALMATFHVSLGGIDAPGNGSVGAPLRSIQAAVTAAALSNDGQDIINVQGGTYNNAAFDNNIYVPPSANITDLQILGGWNAGFGTRDPNANPVDYYNQVAVSDGNPYDIQIDDANTTVDGFNFYFRGDALTGTRRGGGVLANSTGITVSNNNLYVGLSPIPTVSGRIPGLQTGFGVDTSGLQVLNNNFDINTPGTGAFAGSSYGIYVNQTNFARTSPIVISGNTFSGDNMNSAIMVDRDGNVQITGNTINRSSPFAPFPGGAIALRTRSSALSPMSNITITNNTINNTDPTAATAGIALGDLGQTQTISSLTVTGNQISVANGPAIFIDSTVNAATTTINLNSFDSLTPTQTVANGSPGINISGNWLGSNVAATVESNLLNFGAGTLIARAFLSSNTDSNPTVAGLQLPAATEMRVPQTAATSGLTKVDGRIQTGIDRAVAGMTVRVAVDTYAENLTASQSVTLLGANEAISPNTGVRGAESVISGSLNIANGSLGDYVVRGFRFNGSATPLGTNNNVNAGTTNVTFARNLVQNSGQVGLITGFAGAVLNANVLDNSFSNSTSNAMQLTAGSGGVTTAVVSDNTISTTVFGGISTDALTNSSILRNTISGTPQQAIQIAGVSSNVTVAQNTITNANTSNDTNRGAIRIRPTSFTGPVVVSNNFISGSFNGISVPTGETIPAGLLSVTNNSLTSPSGGSFLVRNNGTGTLDTSGNWFGTNAIAGVTAAISGTVDYTPYLNSGIDIAPATPGFQGNFASLTVHTAGAQTGAIGRIQEGINLATIGGTVNVLAGTYAENVLVNKAVTVQGAQAGNDADARFAAFTSGVDGPKASSATETVLTSPVNNPTGGNPGANDLIRVTASNVTLDGLVIDGNNPALGASSVIAAGVNLHARRGITNIDSSNGFNPVNNLLVTNSIIQNVADRGISLANNGPVSTGNALNENLIRNFGDPSVGGYGVLLGTNAYANVTNNTIDVGGNSIGITSQNFFSNGSMTWSGNNLAIGQDAFGIHANLFYAPNATINIQNNTINAKAGVTGTSDFTWGINVWSTQVGSTVNIANNIVGAAGGELARGINLWNNPTTVPITVSGGTVGNSLVGINLDGVDPYYGPTSTSTYNVQNVAVSGGIAGIRLRNNPITPAPFFGSNVPNGSLTLNLSGTSVTGATTGIVMDDVTADAFTTTLNVGTGNSISGGTTGLQMTGAQAILSGNSLNNLAFTGQSGNYITLASGAHDNTELNATAVTFGGLTGAGATNTQNFAIEDKITNAIDDGSLGYVRVKANNVFVTPNSFNSPATTNPSVQRAIDTAVNGNVVNIMAGSYPTGADATAIGKGVTLAAGSSPGQVTIAGNLVLDSNDTLAIEVEGTNPATQYDNFVVNGGVTLGNAVLTFSGSYVPNTLDTFVLIGNDLVDPVNGTFNGLAAGSIVNVNGTPKQIFYTGNDGNDVVLTTAIPETVYVEDIAWNAFSFGQFILDADFGTAGDQSAIYGYSAFNSVTTALSTVSTGGTVIVNAGNYAEAVASSGTKTIEVTGPDAAQVVTIDSLTTSAGQGLVIEGASTLIINSGTIAGVISGSGALTKATAGTLTLSGANTYTGLTTVSGGTLNARNSAALGSAAAGTVVANTAALELQDGITVSGELLQITGDGGALRNVGGTNTWAGNINVSYATITSNTRITINLSTSLIISGDINAAGTAANSLVIQGSGSSTISGNISGLAGLIKSATGDASLTLSGTNTYSGPTLISNGTIIAASSSALGATSSGITIASGATLDVRANIGTEPVTSVLGTGEAGIGALVTNSGIGTVGGPVTLSGSTSIGGAGTLNISGAIGETGGARAVTKIGAGTTTLSGTNTYTGTTTINVGTLALAGGAAVDNNGAVILANTSGVTLSLTNSETIGSLSGGGTTGGSVSLAANTLTTGGNGASTTFAGVINGASGSLVKEGAGVMTLTRPNTYTAGTTLNAGTLLANNATGSATGTGSVTVNGGTLGGTGSISGAVTVNGGTLNIGSPVTGTDNLSTGSLELNVGGTFTPTINNTTVITGYDQLIVSGTVDLTGSTLLLEGSHVPSILALESFIIIDNNTSTDAVIGTFAGLPEGSAIPFNTQTLFISYAGGDGNDVVLYSQPVVNGTPLADSLVLRQVSGDPSLLEFSLNAAPFVQVTSALPFSFVGLGDIDLMYVDTVNSDPLPTGNANFFGELLRVQKSTAGAVDAAVYSPSTTAGAGLVTLTGMGNINFSLTTNVDFVNLLTVDVRTATANDTLTVADGLTTTNGIAVPAGYSTAAAAALVVGGANIPVGLRNVTNVNIDTVTGLNGNDTVSVNSGTTAHGNTNLSIATGTGTDAVTVAGALTVAGNISITSQNIAVNALLTAGAASAITLNAGTGAITTSGAAVDISALNLSATATQGINLDTNVTNITASNTGAGPIRFDEEDGVTLTSVVAANGSIVVNAGLTAAGTLTATSVLSTTDSDANDIALQISGGGDLVVGTINAGATAGDVTLTTSGSITDLDATDPDITADNLSMGAVGGGIGLVGNPLETAVVSLDAITGGAGIFIADAGTLAIDNNGSFTGVAVVTGDVVISATGLLTLNNNVSTLAGNVSLTSVGMSFAGGAAQAPAVGGVVTLNAGTGAISTNGTGNDVTGQDLLATATTGINLDTMVLNVTATNSGAGNINIDEVDGANVLNVAATNGSSTVTTATGNLSVTTVSATTTATVLATTGSITDANAAANNITASSLAATAATGIDLDTTVAFITATTTAAGSILLDELNAVQLTSVSTANGPIVINAGGAINAVSVASLTDVDANDISITATTGNITVGVITAGTSNGDVTLLATTGSIVDDVDVVADVIGDVVTLTAASGVGEAAGNGSLDTTANVLDVSVTAAGLINLNETNVVTLTAIDTANGPITITAGGAMLATSVISTTDSDANDISLSTTAGNIAVGTINAGAAGDVTLSAAAAITDVDATNPDITADDLVLLSTSGIGAGDALEVIVSNLEAVGGAGGVFVANSGDLTMGLIGPTVGVSATGGDIIVTTTGLLTIAEDVTATGANVDITLTAIDAAGIGQNLVLSGGVTVSSAAASVTLNAGDDATITGSITSGTSTTINVDADNADGGTGGLLSITGVITTPVSDYTFLNGETDNDTFTFNPQTSTEFRVFGNLPTATLVGDTLVMNVTGTTNPNLTVPGSIAPYTGPGSGTWTFTSAHRPVRFGSIEDSLITGNYHLTYDNGVAPVGNLVVMRDATQTRLQLRDGSVAGTILYQTPLAPVLSLTVLGSAGDDTVTVDDINTLVDFAGTIPAAVDNTNLLGTPEFLFDGNGNTLGGSDTLVFNINGATASQTYAIGNGTGGTAGLEGEIQSIAAGITLQSFFQDVELASRTGNGATAGGLTILGGSAGDTISTAANGTATRTSITNYTPFQFTGNNYTTFTVNGLGGGDSIDLVSFGSAQTNNFPITLNGEGGDDNIRLHSTSLNTGLVTLLGGLGDDTIHLGNLSNNVNNIDGLVVVDGTDGVPNLNDTLIINDSGDNTADNVLVAPVNAASSDYYKVEGINGLTGDDVIFRNIDNLDYTSTSANNVIDGQFYQTNPTHDLNTVALSGWLGADQFLLFTSDQLGGTGPAPNTVASGVGIINLFGDATGNPNMTDGNDTFGETPPPPFTGTGIMNVGMVVSDSVRMLRPSASTAITINGGRPTGLAAPMGDTVGDVLNLDISALPETSPVVVSTYLPGRVVAAGISPFNWSEIEDINLVDQGKLTNVQMGDLFARLTDINDLVQISRDPTPTNPNQVRLRLNNSITNYSASNKTIIYGRGGADTITQTNLTISAEFYGEIGNDNLTGASNNDWLVGGQGNDRVSGANGDNVLWGDDSPTDPGDLVPQESMVGGNDTITGGTGSDVVYGGGGNDNITMLGGNDYAYGGYGNDIIDGGAGDDRVYGGAGNDQLSGYTGNDLLSGGDNDDKIYGQLGNDVMIGGMGVDLMDGDAGNDILISGKVANETSIWTSVASVGPFSANTYSQPAANDAALLTLLTQWGSFGNRIGLIATITHDGVDDDLNGKQGDDDMCWEAADILDDGPTALAPPGFNGPGMGIDQRFGPPIE
ncbi:autotransporter-associated beta strand repeat-containing protein [Anatilimnocola sp. NA78]|uniref:autotransporter-associated beta strand repeat-containing protein n=1 Tax=Anatilimnocola sp. NA78 TaxID=3415683 RepID=UPI003CE45B1C